jgi:uncharacterized membrane protein (GlpM family)
MGVNPAPPAPTEPYANKAIVSALGTVVLVLLRWATSGEFQYTDEGLITLAGAITSLAVYAVSNYRRVLGLKDERGLSAVEVLLIIFLVLVVLLVLFRLA